MKADETTGWTLVTSRRRGGSTGLVQQASHVGVPQYTHIEALRAALRKEFERFKVSDGWEAHLQLLQVHLGPRCANPLTVFLVGVGSLCMHRESITQAAYAMTVVEFFDSSSLTVVEPMLSDMDIEVLSEFYHSLRGSDRPAVRFMKPPFVSDAAVEGETDISYVCAAHKSPYFTIAIHTPRKITTALYEAVAGDVSHLLLANDPQLIGVEPTLGLQLRSEDSRIPATMRYAFHGQKMIYSHSMVPGGLSV